MAIKGKGIAWIPYSLVNSEIKTNKLKIAGDESWQIPLEISIFRQKIEMNIAAEKIWKNLILKTNWYQDYSISIGELPRAQELVFDWAELHQKELVADWRLYEKKNKPIPTWLIDGRLEIDVKLKDQA